MSFGADGPAAFRHRTRLIQKILEGRRPKDIPIEQPTKFELVITGPQDTRVLPPPRRRGDRMRTRREFNALLGGVAAWPLAGARVCAIVVGAHIASGLGLS